VTRNLGLTATYNDPDVVQQLRTARLPKSGGNTIPPDFGGPVGPDPDLQSEIPS